MSILTIVQQFCGRTNLPTPASVNGSTDRLVVQVKGMLEEEGNDLAQRGDWEALVIEATHTTLAIENQGSVSTIAANGFRRLMLGSVWDRTARLPVNVLTGPEWQQRKGVGITGPRYSVRIRGGRLLANPIPPAGNIWAFEYVSKNWILGVDGTTYKTISTLDTDESLLPEELLLAGLKWRWKKEKGFEYAEDFATYERQVVKALGNAGTKKTLSMSDAPTGAGIYVPESNWNVP